MIKKILKFYYSADGLERYFDGKIMKIACDANGSVEGAAYRICGLIEEKRALARLWGYLDGILSQFSESDRRALQFYAYLRCGLKGQPAEIFKAVRRAVVRLSRRLKIINFFSDGLRLVNEYDCLTGR